MTKYLTFLLAPYKIPCMHSFIIIRAKFFPSTKMHQKNVSACIRLSPLPQRHLIIIYSGFLAANFFVQFSLLCCFRERLTSNLISNYANPFSANFNGGFVYSAWCGAMVMIYSLATLQPMKRCLNSE